jgi:prepilin-type N-terminal cleavage/methylation domain-containing protein
MFSADTNGPDCWKCSLNVEWHDCSWCPAIIQRRGIEIRSGAATVPSPSPSVLPNPSHRKNLPKPMKKILFAPRRPSAGFTLVELLTVIAIIAILAAMLLPVFASAKKHAYMMKAKTEISGLVTAIEAYDQDYGRFPVSTTAQQAANNAGPNNNPDFTYGWNTGTQTFGTQTGSGYLNNSEVIIMLMDLQQTNDALGVSGQTFNYGHLKNPKQVKYLNAKFSGYNPGLNTPNPPGGVDWTGVYRDPWGNPYVISMDLNYDGQCEDWLYCQQAVSLQSGSSGWFGLSNPYPGKNRFQFHGTVMVWSAGPDGKWDAKPASGSSAGFNKDNILSWQ